MNDKNMQLDVIVTIIAGTLLVSILMTFIIYFILLYKRKQQDFEWEREQFKQALLKTEIEIQEQTLSDISRELHDNYGQITSLIKINLNLISSNIPIEDKNKIKDSIELLKSLIKDIKSLSVSLKGENLLRFGLKKMIQEDMVRLKNLNYFDIELINIDLLPKFNQEINIFLFRMYQEIINNCLKHANASKMSLVVNLAEEHCSLTFMDDGIGFDTNTAKLGSGLINLKERCKMIKADIKMSSEINKGTEIVIALKHNNYA